MLNMPQTQPTQLGAQSQVEVVQVTAVEAISRAEINQAIATARQYARILPQVKQKMMNFACLDEETAESCFYTLPRGGKNIQGPSVRLAEIAVMCYGNIRIGTRIIEAVTSGDSPHVTIQAVAMDLESNASVTIEKRRRIIGKKSAGGAISEDDINLAANAGSAIAFRDAVFKIVPMALVKPVYEACMKTAIGDAKSLTDRRARCLDSFAKMGIAKDRIIAKLEKKSVEEIGLEDLETLIGLYTALRDGELTVDEAFPVVESKDKPSPAKSAASAPAPVNLAPKPAATTQAAPAPTKAPAAKPAPTPAAVATPPASEPESPKQPETPAPATEAAPEPSPEPEPGEASSPAPAPAPAQEVNPKDAGEALAIVSEYAGRDGIQEHQIMTYLCSVKPPLAKPGQKLSDMSFAKLNILAKNWDATGQTGKSISQQIKELAGQN